MKRFVLLVCGGRDFIDMPRVSAALDAVQAKRPITLLVHGAARGADTLAATWAQRRSVPTLAFPADWERDGKAAGPLRNQRMLDEARPDGVVAFPGGRGTADMKQRARAAGVTVWDP